MDDVVVDCPVCGEPAEHALLKATEHSITVQCRACGDTRTTSPPRLRTVELKLVVSSGEEARSERLETPSDEEIAVGDEFEFDGHRLIVTGLEMREGKADKALAPDIHVLHAKVFDTVPLKLSVNEGDITRSYLIDVDPDRPVQIGEILRAQDRLLQVKTLKSDQNRTLHRGGLPARHIVRAFCDPAPRFAKEGQVKAARPRGKPKGATSTPRHGAPRTGPARTGSKRPGPRTGGGRKPTRGGR